MAYPSHTPQCVLITGATGGFGKTFVERFAALGAKLIIHGRSVDKVKEICDSVDVPIHPLIFDITDKQATLDALNNIPSDFQDIDLLINNAGGALGLDKFQEAPLEDLEGMIEMNNTSLIRITRQILPGMVERTSGHIINIGSIAGNWPYPGGHVYCGVKSFVQQFSLALRCDLVGTNVRVTNIEPGMAETPFSLNRFKGDADKAAQVYAGTTALTADDIAESVVWSACLPKHVNVNTLEVMPTDQSLAPLHVEREN